MLLKSSLVVALSACNAVYGLSKPVRVDGGIFDGHPDAPFVCPSGPALQFAHANLVQVIAQNCTDYTRSEGTVRALANCNGTISQALPDQLLEPTLGFEPTGTQFFSAPRIAPEGDYASILEVNAISGSPMMKQVFAQYDGARWNIVGKLNLATPPVQTSEPSRSPGRHILVMFNTYVLHEFVEEPPTWRDVGTSYNFPIASGHIHLSADALRAYWEEADGIHVVERATPDATFPAIPFVLLNTAGFDHPFITADCGRVYFYTLQSVWIAGQSPG